MKRVLVFTLLLMLLCLPSMAESRVIDQFDLFTEQEEAVLEQKIEAIRSAYQTDVAIVALSAHTGYDVKVFAADYYEAQDFGMGNNKDGLVFLISMRDRDYCTVTHGSAKRAFTDWGIDQIHEDVQPYLTRGQYFDGMERYLSHVERFLAQAQNGRPYDVRNPVHLKPVSARVAEILPLILGCAAVAAIIVSLRLKSKMKTVRRQAAASSYVRDGSFELTRTQDIYLYTTTTRRKIETSSSSGGSSSFRSSSGGSYGGRSGKF